MAEWKPRKTWEQYIEEDKKGLEQPFFDPIDILAGVGGAARSIGSKALAGLLPDVVGGIAADTVSDRGNAWAPLAANVGASLLAGRMLDPANLAEIRRIAPKSLANERGMFTPPTGEDLQRLARMAAGEDVEVPRVFSALHDRMPRVEIDDSGAALYNHDPFTDALEGFRRGEIGLEELQTSRQLPKNQPWLDPSLRRKEMSDVLNHETLYNTDPSTARVGYVRDAKSERVGIGNAAYSGPENLVVMGAQADPAGVTGSLLHELQHAVQERAGFARGGSPQQFASGPMFDGKAKDLAADLSVSLTGTLTARPDEIKTALKYGDPSEVAAIARKHGFDSVEKAIEFLDYQDWKRTPFGQYQRLAGEIEARDTASRMNLSEMARASTQPYSGYAVRPDGSFGPTYEQNPIRLEDFIVRH